MRRLVNARHLRSACFLLVAGFSVIAEAQVAQAPLSLTEGVPPNMIFTLDDSGSMKRSHVPDSIAADTTMRTKRAKSAHFNPAYYDPNTTYVIPEGANSNGELVEYNTSFTTAYHMGFKTGLGSVDLSKAYRATWYCTRDKVGDCKYGVNGFGSVKELAENPSEDFRVQATVTSSATTATVTTPGGIVYKISRTGSGCSATASWNGIAFSTVPCSRSGNTATVDLRTSAVPAYYYVFNATLTGCDGKRGTEACYTLRLVQADEQKNFAIWYSFYRDRALATQSAAMLAFHDLSPSVRLTWQSLNNCTSFNAASGCGNNKFGSFEKAHKGQFLGWLTDVKFSGGTPLRVAMDKAGKFLQSDVAWYKNPRGTTADDKIAYACRPSYHVMMTDGMWNGSDGSPTGTRIHDNQTVTLPDEMTYSAPKPPFSDSTASTLADLAMHYWATDLNTKLDNDLKTFFPIKEGAADEKYWEPRNNPATWQHMVNFIMGLGLTEALSNPSVPWSGGTFEGVGYQGLKSGDLSWPKAASDSANNVYDLWHAAINSRGEFFSVDNPDAMVQAFKEILNRIAERTGTAASPAINSGVLEEEGGSLVSYAYHSYYYSDENWAGDLKGISRSRVLNEETKQWELQTNELWSARAKLDARSWEGRNITIANAAGNGLQKLAWTSAGNHTQSGSLAHYLKNDPDKVESPCNSVSCAQKRLNFIRGDRSDENDLLRQRKSVLGDFVSSRPASVRGARYLVGYANSIERNTAYGAFEKEQEDRAPHIYVGANDGMLHAFNAKTGEETFAFVPTAVFPNLHRLTGKTYGHHFYVDGSPVVADVYIEHGGQKKWRTVLVGTLRAGGKGLFALDITDPTSISLLWEFSDADIPALDGNKNTVRLGYSFPQPTIARLHNGKWAVVTGNGYDSEGHTHGKASLLIIDMATGQLTKSLEVEGASGVPNGLSSPRLVDVNVDGVADYAYAGDLQGNLWRFNLTPHKAGAEVNPFARAEVEGASAESHFKVSYGGKPLFKAVASDGSRQPITAPPAVIRHPSRYGHLVIVGTGKYFEVGDKSGTTEKQTLYGIWDTHTRSTSGNESGPGGVAAGTLTRTRLQQQTYDANLSVAGSIRTLSQNPIKWAIPPQPSGGSWVDNDGHKYGWYFDLSEKGEMTIESMLFVGQTLFFQTLVPNDDPCENGADNWTHAINPYTGGRTRHHAFKDIRLTGTHAGTPVTTVNHAGEGGLTLGLDPTGEFVVCTGESCLEVDPDPESIGRQSWRRVGE